METEGFYWISNGHDPVTTPPTLCCIKGDDCLKCIDFQTTKAHIRIKGEDCTSPRDAGLGVE